MKEVGGKIRQYKRGTFLLLLVLNLFMLTGCLEEIELEEKVIVAMVGIDRTDKGIIRVTMGLINTRSIEEKEPAAIEIYTSEGDTVFEAVRSSILKLGRQPQWPYIKVVVFGPAFSEVEVGPILDFFNRNNEVQPNPYIVFSHVLAEDIVNLESDLVNIPAVIVEGQFRHQNLVGYTPDVKLHNFTEMMFSPDKVGIASIIKKTFENDNFIPMVEGTAVIKGGKWIGDLSIAETRGLLWVREEVRGGIIVIPSIEGEGKVSLEIIEHGKISINPILKNGKLSVQFDLEQLVSISEIMTYMDLNEKNIELIRKATEKQITEEIEVTLEKAKEWKADIFDIGRAVHRKYPKYWQEQKDNWEDRFSTLPIDINVHVDIKTIGLLRSLQKIIREHSCNKEI